MSKKVTANFLILVLVGKFLKNTILGAIRGQKGGTISFLCPKDFHRKGVSHTTTAKTAEGVRGGVWPLLRF